MRTLIEEMEEKKNLEKTKNLKWAHECNVFMCDGYAIQCYIAVVRKNETNVTQKSRKSKVGHNRARNKTKYI